jgi:hypothetical protein
MELLIFLLFISIAYIIYQNLYIPPVTNDLICHTNYDKREVNIKFHFIASGDLQNKEECYIITKNLYINTSLPIQKITKFILNHDEFYRNEVIGVRRMLHEKWGSEYRPVLKAVSIDIRIL